MTPITAETYAKHGLPFFKTYNEKSSIKGDFEGIKSVKTIDKTKAEATAGDTTDWKATADEHLEQPLMNPVILLTPDGAKKEFKPMSELRKELASLHAMRF